MDVKLLVCFNSRPALTRLRMNKNCTITLRNENIRSLFGGASNRSIMII